MAKGAALLPPRTVAQPTGRGQEPLQYPPFNSKERKIRTDAIAEISRLCGILVLLSQAGPMYVRNREPSLDDLLNDPVTRLVMARDGFSDEAVRRLIAEARQRLLGGDGSPVQAAAVVA
jgi:hypothetical protein